MTPHAAGDRVCVVAAVQAAWVLDIDATHNTVAIRTSLPARQDLIHTLRGRVILCSSREQCLMVTDNHPLVRLREPLALQSVIRKGTQAATR
jgi:hypothetical protein